MCLIIAAMTKKRMCDFSVFQQFLCIGIITLFFPHASGQLNGNCFHLTIFKGLKCKYYIFQSITLLYVLNGNLNSFISDVLLQNVNYRLSGAKIYQDQDIKVYLDFSIENMATVEGCCKLTCDI